LAHARYLHKMTSEESVGITAHTTNSISFRAVTKQRFSDFIVHEIDLCGVKTTLKSINYDRPVVPDALSSVDLLATLTAAFGDETARASIALQEEQPTAGGASDVQLPRDDDKDRRREAHQLVKLHLPALESDTLDLPDGGKCVRLQRKRQARAARQEQSGGRGGRGGGNKRRRVDDRGEWEAEAGDKKYLSFTLYKENRWRAAAP
jgi:hypothetical protein